MTGPRGWALFLRLFEGVGEVMGSDFEGGEGGKE